MFEKNEKSANTRRTPVVSALRTSLFGLRNRLNGYCTVCTVTGEFRQLYELPSRTNRVNGLLDNRYSVRFHYIISIPCHPDQFRYCTI